MENWRIIADYGQSLNIDYIKYCFHVKMEADTKIMIPLILDFDF